MKTLLVLLAFALMTPFAFGQTTRARVRTNTANTAGTVPGSFNASHIMAVNSFAPGDRIVVQTSGDTHPVSISLNGADVAYVTAAGQQINPNSIRPGSHVRLEFTGTGQNRVLTRIVLVSSS